MLMVKRCLVTGRVQGVYFRASTQQHARKLGVTGHAKNLANGGVEVLAVGGAPEVEALVQWLWQGPPSAQVTHVDIEEVSELDLDDVPTEFITT
jgi:acylphosphatase